MNEAALAETRPRGAAAALLARVGRGVGGLSLGAITGALSQILIVPAAMLAWGQARYGEWVIITGFATFLRLTDLGLQTFVVNRLGASHARGDRDDVQHALNSTVAVQIPLAMAFLGVLALVLLVLPMQRVLGLQTIGGWRLYAVLMILSAELLLTIAMSVVAGVYRATEHLARAAVIAAVIQALTLGLTIGLMFAHADFIQVAAARLAMQVVSAVYILRDLRRLHGWLRISPRLGNWREGAAMVVPGLFFLLMPLADFVSQQLTLMIVQQHLAGAEVSRLATHRTVVNLSQMVSNLLIGAVWFELTTLHARDETDRLARVQRGLVTFNVWMVSACLLGMLPFIGWVYPRWTAGKLALDWITLGLLIARLIVWSGWNASMTVLLATNRHRTAAVALLGAAVVTCLLSLALVPAYGIRGAALAAVLGDLAVPAWLIPRLAGRATGVSAWSIAGSATAAFLRGAGLPAAAAAGAWFLVPVAAVRYGIVVPAAVGLAVWQLWKTLPPPDRAAIAAVARGRLSNMRNS